MIKINHDCIKCGHRFMHDVSKPQICEYCEEPEMPKVPERLLSKRTRWKRRRWIMWWLNRLPFLRIDAAKGGDTINKPLSQPDTHSTHKL